ncbi:MAG TPA: antibiotic biosynthesis monooxygenase [Acetobacteraceae bacterium]|jgi:heme-degrading monooxygenase HmoA|nr:antibiotic biosynthesis monooxygenase [Acetobacteraceae bacterium]
MFAVIFEVSPRPDAWDAYLGHAASLRPELLAIDGFLANERYASLQRPGWLVSLSIWRDEKALIRWRTHPLHHDIQGKGRTLVFADYHLRVGEIVSDSELDAPPPRYRFDTTDAGTAKAVTLTERPLDSATPILNGNVFDSISRPGNGLYLCEWPDVASAQAAVAGTPGRHRVVHVIRDYGMFDRAEAPQYFPS